MSEIFREVDEALTYDRMRVLWKRHRLKVFATLVLTLVSLAGWQAWQYRQQQQRTRAAEAFFEILRKNDTSPATQSTMPALSPQEQEDLRGGYRMLWLFSRAKVFAQRQEWQKAQQALQQVANDSALPLLYQGYAQIWQASLDIEQGQLGAAEKRLATLNDKSKKTIDNIPPLQGLALYLQATLLAAQGKKESARNLLTRARAIDNLAPALRRQLQEAERTLDTPSTP